MRYLLLSLALLLPLSVLAHDDADWINRGNYKNQRNEHCCGQNDCGVVPHSDVSDNGDHYIYIPTQERIEKRYTHMSKDGNYWRCHYYAQGIKMTRCFFYPYKGA